FSLNLSPEAPVPLSDSEFINDLLESIHDGILIADKDSIVRYVNGAYTRITGVARDAIVGKPLRSVRPGARLPDAIKSQQDMHGVIRKEGDIEYIVDMFPIRARGEVIGGISIVFDITQQRALARDLERSRSQIDELKSRIRDMHRAHHTFDDIIGRDGGLAHAVNFARKAAESDSTIILRGESGTGKEVFAQAIHNASRRAGGPFVTVNCAAIPPQLLESELFGYVRGAFTGASASGKTGLFQIASGGTIFLDEIGELDASLQAKLLRVIQDRRVRPVGANNPTGVDVRIMSATNRDLEKAVRDGAFRQDLYYRLSVLPVSLPPLRERRQDIPALIERFVGAIGERRGVTYEVSAGAIEAMLNYSWPGNLRELQNALEYATHVAEGLEIRPEYLPAVVCGITRQTSKDGHAHAAPEPGPRHHRSLSDELADHDRRIIMEALRDCGWTVNGKKAAAARLGISLASLYNRIKQHRITPSDIA
ncbi:MAG: sigma-54 interaction domain-containing protein, partial [Bacillota bacterium]